MTFSTAEYKLSHSTYFEMAKIIYTSICSKIRFTNDYIMKAFINFYKLYNYLTLIILLFFVRCNILHRDYMVIMLKKCFLLNKDNILKKNN